MVVSEGTIINALDASEVNGAQVCAVECACADELNVGAGKIYRTKIGARKCIARNMGCVGAKFNFRETATVFKQANAVVIGIDNCFFDVGILEDVCASEAIAFNGYNCVCFIEG
jgi:hypothetical protein